MSTIHHQRSSESTHRPLPSHLSQFGHLGGRGVGVDPSEGSSESLQYIVGLAVLGLVNAEAITSRTSSKKRIFILMMRSATFSLLNEYYNAQIFHTMLHNLKSVRNPQNPMLHAYITVHSADHIKMHHSSLFPFILQCRVQLYH